MTRNPDRRTYLFAVPRHASSARIARAVAEVLDDPRYRAAAGELGRAIARDAGGSTLIDELEGVPARG
jgi:UDP:flavonoid glycosyltransferase YjiC (YdhE family)